MLSFDILAPYYDTGEGYALHEVGGYHHWAYPGRSSWLPLWAIFGYFEPTVLEDAPRTVPLVANM